MTVVLAIDKQHLCPLVKGCVLFFLYIAGFTSFSPAWSDANIQVVEFNSSFLRSNVDVSQFSQGNPVHPGIHKVNLYLNNTWKGQYWVEFQQFPHGARIARPCFDLQTILATGIDVNKLSTGVRAQLNASNQCLQLEHLIEGSSAKYDSSSQGLDISVPQIYLARQARGYVDPSLWDEGIAAATLQYSYNAYWTGTSGLGSQSNQYLGLRGGVNWDVWRLRYRGTLQRDSDTRNFCYQSTATYLERSIAPLKSRLIIGDSSTDGQVFDSLNFRGIQLSSDDRMFPDSQRGFAPVIQGIANSNALVKVSQNGIPIYEMTVPPGSFVIDDIYSTGQGGDFLVTIKEADGSEHGFTVSNSSIAELLRPGTTQFSLMVGRFRSPATKDEPVIAVGSIRHGFSNLLTGYGGTLGTQGYIATSLGIALNTHLGAFSFDTTHAQTDISGGTNRKGTNLRLSYAKVVAATDTSIMVTTNHTMDAGYYDARSALILRDDFKYGLTNVLEIWNQRNRFSINASQNFPAGYGALSLNASYQDYWNHSESSVNYQLNYSNHFKSLTYNIAAQRTRNLTSSQWENQIMVSLSIPLEIFANSPSWNASYTHLSGSSSLNNSLSGTLGSDQQISYSVFANTLHQRGDSTATNVGASGSWNTPYATLSASASTSQNYTQYSMNASGGLVAYSGGLVFAPSVGETIAIIEAPAAQGAGVSSYNNLRLNRSGKAIVPYLNPYRRNAIEIDPKGLSTDVELKASSQYVIPTSGAVTLVEFATDIGYSVLINGQKSNGDPLPFGASVLDEDGQIIGYIAQGGQGIIRVQEPQGILVVKWGDDAKQVCSFDFKLASTQPVKAGEFRQLDIVCR